jgi:hypothetical protein
MKHLWKLGAGLALSCLLIFAAGCSEDDDETPAATHEPTHSAGTTDAGGTVTLDLVDIEVAVTVTAGGEPAQGAQVEIFQGNSLALVWAEISGFYSNFQLLNMSQISGNQSLTIELIEAGIEYYEWSIDPSLFNLLYNDAAFTAHCEQGSIEEIFALAHGWSDFVFFRVYGGGAALREGNIAVGFDFGSLYWDAFAQIAFGFFGYIPQDVVEYCYYTLTIGDEIFVLPTIHIGSIVEQGSPYDYKFILTWGEHPRDLDSHLYTPEIEGSAYHVYYANRGTAEAPPYAWLDVDDVSSYGPEVVTIEQLFPGTYQYAVYEFSGDLTLTESEAVVEVYRGRNLIGTYPIPTTPQAGNNWWWHVGNVDGATGAFTLVNTVTAGSPQMAPADEPMPVKMR